MELEKNSPNYIARKILDVFDFGARVYRCGRIGSELSDSQKVAANQRG
jgi:hypothetical protein